MIRGGVGEENVGREGKRKEDVVLHFSSHVSAEEGTGLGDHISRPGLQMAGSPPVVSAPSAVAVGLKEMSWRQGKFAKSKLGPLLPWEGGGPKPPQGPIHSRGRGRIFWRTIYSHSRNFEMCIKDALQLPFEMEIEVPKVDNGLCDLTEVRDKRCR